MSVNESGLNRTKKNDVQLQTKLINLRRKRDAAVKKINKISKKNKNTSAEIKKLKRYSNGLITIESNITKLLQEIQKNSEKMEEYRKKVSKEQGNRLADLTKLMKGNEGINEGYINNQIELQVKLDELASDIKESVNRKEIIEYDVFLSHSSLDKEEYVAELSDKLEEKGLSVFEDIKVFKNGQSQTDMMNFGILNSRFVVVFLSVNFIESGWSDYEFKSFLNREINEKEIIILPIWHNVTVEEVKNYNPYLVDKYALNTSKYSLDQVVDSIYQVIQDSKES
ncbi:toll/interleukin-1 receptor domain-containing protein [Aerococcaceae bacterium DSM 111021]|nr:toll/interleukin-1 receptor domain-containing protein [Aerococcaceae bacterium DSM 111021]